MPEAGFVIISGNMFDSAVMKTSVVTDEFRAPLPRAPGASRACSRAGRSCSRGRRTITTGSTTTRSTSTRIASCSSAIAARSAIPGAAEVVNMRPPTKLIERGIKALPTIGDGRQSGTSESPSILNASPEAAIGGNLAIVRTGDRVRLDLPNRRARPADPARGDRAASGRAEAQPPKIPPSQTPWQEIYRSMVGQLVDRRLPRARGAAPEDRRDLRYTAAQPLRLARSPRARVWPWPCWPGRRWPRMVGQQWQQVSEAGVEQANRGDLVAAEQSMRGERWPWPSRCAPDDPRRATSANNLGFVLHAQGRTARGAAVLCRGAVAAGREPRPEPPGHGPEPEQPGRGVAQRRPPRRGREAAPTGDRDPPHAAVSPNHPDLAESLNNLGVLLTDEGRFDEAEGAVRRGAGDPQDGAGRAAFGGGRGAGQSRVLWPSPAAATTWPSSCIGRRWRSRRRRTAPTSRPWPSR